ncbi:unnamed protein product [Leptosia nina]|uniref:Uncharacterized protein n=1 Tax=Leptosia nina TaxID=320188 RepID=A0AAV1JUY2_9NEOP
MSNSQLSVARTANLNEQDEPGSTLPPTCYNRIYYSIMDLHATRSCKENKKIHLSHWIFHRVHKRKRPAYLL